MTLYKKLMKATNEMDGNVTAYKYDGVLHEDRYHCCECACFVPESSWNVSMKLCNDCAKDALEKV